MWEHISKIMTTQVIEKKQEVLATQQEEWLHASVIHKLEQHPCFRQYALKLKLEFDGSEVIVNGRLPSYYMKQMLQGITKKIFLLFPESVIKLKVAQKTA